MSALHRVWNEKRKIDGQKVVGSAFMIVAILSLNDIKFSYYCMYYLFGVYWENVNLYLTSEIMNIGKLRLVSIGASVILVSVGDSLVNCI